MSAWVLPDHIADALPSEARHIEKLRRGLLDTARSYGYELVMPPLLEHLESLLTGSGEALDLQTFKLVDQLSGRTLGLRADTTQQVARIYAHLLNRSSVTRLCYCGSVLHTRPDSPHATREPLQFGAEIYGYEGVEADLEALHLALDCLKSVQVPEISVDLADVRIVRSLLAGVIVDEQVLRAVHRALAAKDASELQQLTRHFPHVAREGLRALLSLYGDVEVLSEAEKVLSAVPGVRHVLTELRAVSEKLTDVQVTFDLADLRGYTYYSGMRFGIYAQGISDALVRGGRYDEVGAVFGRNRPAAGFSLDVKQLAVVAAPLVPERVIRAPCIDDAELQVLVAALRSQGEVVVTCLPGQEAITDEFGCDRELVRVAGQWVVRVL